VLSVAAFAAAAVVGALARVGLIARLNRPGFPWGTLVVNLSGSLVAGVVAAHTDGAARTVVATGALGAFTTFSTFTVEVRALWAGGGLRRSGTYLGATVLGAVGAAALGLGL